MSNSSDTKELASVVDLINMQRRHSLKPEKGLAQLESVIRLNNIPIVESGWKYAGNMYSRIKNSNSLTHWTLDTAENSLNFAVDAALPSAVTILNAPLMILDKIVCKSLDVMESRIPSMYLPPQVMVWQTKEYVNDKLVKPVLKRADSVIEVGNAVLASKYTAYAADTLDSALNVADKYVDRYLPDAADQAIDDADSANSPPVEGPTGKAVNTIHHVDRFSRKLQRRLTKRTIAEAKALKHRSAESIHVLLYVAELVATDPKQALTKAMDLWKSLSADEPENQARPTTLEQLIVMLTRESARRVVHLINFTRATVSKLPHTLSVGVNLTTNQCVKILDSLVKTIRVEGEAQVTGARKKARRMSTVLEQINVFTTILLRTTTVELSIFVHMKIVQADPLIDIMPSSTNYCRTEENSNPWLYLMIFILWILCIPPELLHLERLALAVAGQPEMKKMRSTKHRNSHHYHAGQHIPSISRNVYRAGGQHRHSNSMLNNGAQS